MKKIRAHKIASSTYRLGIAPEIDLLEEGMPEVGNVVVVQALEEKRVYSELELVTGRLAKILKGDVLVGSLGGRMALKGFVGRVPERLAPGGRLHVLNMGGVIGECTSAGGDIGRALETRFLGMAVRDGRVLNTRMGAVPESERLPNGCPPLVLVGGSCMNSGKTHAACEVIAGLTARGIRVAAGKVSGVACLRDQLNMVDHGALKALSFLDCGHPSTARFRTVVGITKGILAALMGMDPEVIILELGDGVIGGYGASSVFADPEIRDATGLLIFCANDLVSAWGGQAFLREMGVEISILAGPVTDNEVGVAYGEQELRLPSANARTDPDRLAGLVVQALSRARRTGEGISQKLSLPPA